MKSIIKKWYEKLGFPKEWDSAFFDLLEKAQRRKNRSEVCRKTDFR